MELTIEVLYIFPAKQSNLLTKYNTRGLVTTNANSRQSFSLFQIIIER